MRDPGTDRNLYDRFFFNGYPTKGAGAGSEFFAAAFGLYPGRNVVDGAFSVIDDGVQHTVRGSRLMGDERLDLHCGPITIEIVEPLHRLRLSIDDPTVRASLEFTSRGPAVEEPRTHYGPGHLTTFDITRLTQNGTWSGWIEAGDRVGAHRVDVRSETWRGTRDRSWGIRPTGEPLPPGAPDTGTHPSPQFFWLWAPINLDDENLLIDVNEWADGSRWHENAMACPVGGHVSSVNSAPQSLRSRSAPVDHHDEVAIGQHTYEITWKPGTRHATAADLHLAFPDGRRLDVHLDASMTFYMQGIGYSHPKWRHGAYLGPDERSSDSQVLAEVNEADPIAQHVQILSRVTTGDGRQGWGILEMAIFGPHSPSGFTGLLDMRP